MRDVKGIALYSIALAAWEAFAIATRRPTVTDLSSRWPYRIPIYLWYAALGWHFIYWSHGDIQQTEDRRR